MKLNTSNVWAVALGVLFSFASCDDWTETESLTIHTPSIEEQNPGLYAQYVQALNAYKASDHKVVIASVDNVPGVPTARNQHLDNLPDSIDYICLNNVLAVSDANKNEMSAVRTLGTKVLGLVDFDAILADWKALLEEEAANATPEEGEEESGESTEGEGENEEPEVTEADRFIEYCAAEVSALIAACDELGVDGIVANYSGYDLNSIVTEEAIAAETARQGAFFNALVEWKTANVDKVLMFKGYPQNVMDKTILNEFKYIIIYAHGAKNLNEMEYLVLMASVNGVPTDRFVMGTTAPYLTAAGTYNGELGDGSSAIVAAASWAVDESAEYTKAGISIDAAEKDYFHIESIYPNIREAINTLSPTLK